MSPDTAHTIFYAGAAVFAAVWIAGILFAYSRLRPRAPAGNDPFVQPPDNADIATGEHVVEGTVETLSGRLVGRLTSLGTPGAPLLRITDSSNGHVAFERTTGTGLGFDGGEVRFTQDGSRVKAAYSINFSRFTRIMRIVLFIVCFAYGGLFVIGTPVLLWHLVVNNEDPSTRMQTLQIVQMIHGAWPPFLVGYLIGRTRRMTVSQFDILLENLAHGS